jgi:MoaA/NifB/PqqE/SkfB family radical SAM enzyme
VPADGISRELAPGRAEREYLEGRVKELKRSAGGIHICFPGDEEAMGGCLAAGRGFVHINPEGGIEPCPFSPVSDTNIISERLEDALKSPLLARIRGSGVMELEHLGGCALWNRRDDVEKMLKEN